MAAVPAGMGFGSALKGAASSAGPQLAQGLAQGFGQQAGSGMASKVLDPMQPPPQPLTPSLPSGQSSQVPPAFQIQPVVSSGSSASPLSFSGGSAIASPSNNMNPQLMRLIQLMNSMGMRG